MASVNGWTFAAVNAIASEVSNIQLRLYQVKGDDHEEQEDHPLLTLLDGVNERRTGIELKYVAKIGLANGCRASAPPSTCDASLSTVVFWKKASF